MIKMDYICDECNGTGEIETIVGFPNGTQFCRKDICKKCNGDGKLNWIENIFGKKENVILNSLIDKIRKSIAVDIASKLDTFIVDSLDTTIMSKKRKGSKNG